MEIKVKWTGEYPNLCSGKWIISIDGMALTGLDNDHFNTFGYFTNYSFNSEYDVESDDYHDGLHVSEWIEEVKKEDTNNLISSLKKHHIKITDELLENLYEEISSSDWRHGSCGGCI